MSSTYAFDEESPATDVPEPSRPLEPGELAWVVALPCALLTLAAILWLGPPIADLSPPPHPERYWPGTPLLPEKVEHARFGIALLGPVLLAAVMLASGAWRIVPRRGWPTRLMTGTAHVALIAFLALCVLAQYSILLYAEIHHGTNQLFDRGTLIGAAIFALLVPIAIRLRRIRGNDRPPATDPRWLRTACLLLAAVVAATCLLPGVNSESTVGVAWGYNLISWDTSETFAILDGLTPLVDFHSQYSQLIPFIPAVTMAVLGASIGVWTVTMTLLNGLALLAVYGVFRRIVRRSILALALYVPFTALSFFLIDNGPKAEVHYTPGAIYSAWPMRYAGPYLLAWLTARHLDGSTPRRTWLLFVVGGLVAINNPDFGLGAFAGSVLAVACVRPPASVRALGRLAGEAAGGLLGAALLVSLLTLIRSGSFPHFSYVLEFPRLYGVDGWFLETMSGIGVHMAVYATFGAAIAVAVARAMRRVEEPVLTGMLGWSGVFGLGAGSYYLGRSDILNLVTLFSTWAFALALLTIVVVRALAARARPLPTLPELAVLFGLGLAVCAIPEVATPWSQIDRLQQHGAKVFTQPELKAFVDKTTRPGEKVAILAPFGHRLAYDLGLRNVAPYSMPDAMPTISQLWRTIHAMDRAGVHTLYVGTAAAEGGNAFGAELQRVGFAQKQMGPLTVWTDERNGRAAP